MTEDGPVLDPTEFDIEDDERVREIGEDRYVVSASGDPPGPRADDTLNGRRDGPPAGGHRGDGRRGESAGSPENGVSTSDTPLVARGRSLAVRRRHPRPRENR